MRRLLPLLTLFFFVAGCVTVKDSIPKPKTLDEIQLQSINATTTAYVDAVTGVAEPNKMVWSSNAEIGLYELVGSSANNENVECIIQNTEPNLTTAKFTGRSSNVEGWIDGNKTLWAYYPFSAVNSSLSRISFMLPVEQMRIAADPYAHLGENCAMLVSKNVTGDNTSTPDLTLNLISTKLGAVVTNSSSTPITVSKITYRSATGTENIFYSTAAYNTSTHNVVVGSSIKKPTLTLTFDENPMIVPGSNEKFEIGTFSVTIPDGLRLRLDVTTDVGVFSFYEQFPTPAGGLVFAPGKAYNYNFEITDDLIAGVSDHTVLPGNQNTFLINPPTTEGDTWDYYIPLDMVFPFWNAYGPGNVITSTTPWVAEMVWKDFDLDDAGGVVTFIEGMDKGTGPSAYIGIRVKGYAADPYGNFIVGVKKADAAGNPTGDYLWSWHLWICDVDEETDWNAYPTNYSAIGNIDIMNRNLGAKTRAYPTGASDPKSFGMIYAWGRKDPFPAPPSAGGTTYSTVNSNGNNWVNTVPYTEGGTLPYVVGHPSTIIAGVEAPYPWLIDINLNMTLWKNSEKTMFDPCPKGWKVARQYWSSMFALGSTISINSNSTFSFLQGGVVVDSYPRFGRTATVENKTFSNTSYGYVWCSAPYTTDRYGYMTYVTGTTVYASSTTYLSAMIPVRCQRWDE